MKHTQFLYILCFLIFCSCKEQNNGKQEWTITFNEKDSTYEVLHQNNKFGNFTLTHSKFLVFTPVGNENKKIFLDTFGIALIGQYKNEQPYGCFYSFNDSSVLRELKWYHRKASFATMSNLSCDGGNFIVGEAENVDVNLITLPDIELNYIKEDSMYKLFLVSKSYPINLTSISTNLSTDDRQFNLLMNSFIAKFKKEEMKGDTLKLEFMFKDMITGNVIKSLSYNTILPN